MSLVTYVASSLYPGERGVVNAGNGVPFDVGAALIAGAGQFTLDDTVNPLLVSVLNAYPGVMISGSTPSTPVQIDSLGPLIVHSKGTSNAIGDFLARGPDGYFAPIPAVAAVFSGQTGQGAITPTAGRPSTIAAPTLRNVMEVEDQGADPTGVADSATAIRQTTSRLQAAGGGKSLYGWGSYLMNSVDGNSDSVPHLCTGQSGGGGNTVVHEGQGWGPSGGKGATTITLTANCKRFVQHSSQFAADSTFQGAFVINMTIDAGGNPATENSGAVITTQLAGGVRARHLNVSRVGVFRVNMINGGTSGGATPRSGVAINLQSVTGDNPTTIMDVNVVEYDQVGGLFGFTAQANGTGASANVFVDHIHFDQWFHDTTVVVSTFIGSEAFGCGSLATCGSDIRLTNGRGKNHTDVTWEIDNFQHVIVSSVISENPFNAGHYFGNFAAPANPLAQTMRLNECHVIYSYISPTTGGFVCYNAVGSGTPLPFGTIIMTGGSYTSTATTMVSTYQAIRFGSSSANVQLACKSVTIENFSINITGFTSSVAANFFAVLIGLTLVPPTLSGVVLTPTVRIRNINYVVAGTASNSTYRLYGMHLGNGDHNIDGFRINSNITGAGAGCNRCLSVSSNTATAAAVVTGKIKGVYVDQLLVDTAPKIIEVGNSTNLTITNNSSLLVDECNFAACPAGGTEIAYVTTGQNQAGVKYGRNIIWKTGVIVRKQTAGSTSLFAAWPLTSNVWDKYMGGSDVTVTMTGGTGVITVDISPDGGTTPTNILTQAAAPISGVLQFPLYNGWSIRVVDTANPTTQLVFAS